MNKDKIEYYLSKDRIGKFLSNTYLDYSLAEKLYISNIKLSETFYPLLSLLEICLRNSLNDVISKHFSDTYWLNNQINGFMSVSSLSNSRFRLKEKVIEAISKLGQSNLTQSKIIAELSFGFWTYLFDPNHYRLLQGVPIKIFKNKPPQIGRNDLYRILNNIWLFRNRIYHYEPVCFVNRLFDTSETENMYDYIKDIFQWLDTDLLLLLNETDSVHDAIKQINKVFLKQ